MKEITTIKEIQDISLDILKHIKTICEKNDIRYYLDAGTLLGAVRHKGFIPWDDDIDICMSRDDFEKLIKVYTDLNDKTYSLLCLETDSTYSLPLPKIVDNRTVLQQTNQNEIAPIGVYVDIFVYDNLPNDDKKRVDYFKQQKQIQKKWTFFQYKPTKSNSIKGIIRRLVQLFFLKCNMQRYYAEKLSDLAVKYRDSKTDELGSMMYVCNREKEIYRKEWFCGDAFLTFEGEEFRVPTNYDAFLKTIYGSDYMIPPPERERVSHHSTKIFWK